MQENNFLENRRKERINRSYIDESVEYNTHAIKYTQQVQKYMKYY